MNLIKNKYFVAFAVAAGIVLLWVGYRQYNSEKISEALGAEFSDTEKYQGTEAWNYGPNWDGYEIGNEIPEAVKQ